MQEVQPPAPLRYLLFRQHSLDPTYAQEKSSCTYAEPPARVLGAPSGDCWGQKSYSGRGLLWVVNEVQRRYLACPTEEVSRGDHVVEC